MDLVRWSPTSSRQIEQLVWGDESPLAFRSIITKELLDPPPPIQFDLIRIAWIRHTRHLGRRGWGGGGDRIRTGIGDGRKTEPLMVDYTSCLYDKAASEWTIIERERNRKGKRESAFISLFQWREISILWSACSSYVFFATTLSISWTQTSL